METRTDTLMVKVTLEVQENRLDKKALAELLDVLKDYPDGEIEDISYSKAEKGAFSYHFKGTHDWPFDETLKAHLLYLGNFTWFRRVLASTGIFYKERVTMLDNLIADEAIDDALVMLRKVPDYSVEITFIEYRERDGDAGEAAAEGLAVLDEVADVVLLNNKPATEDQIRWLNTRIEDTAFGRKYTAKLKEHDVLFIGDFVTRSWDELSSIIGSEPRNLFSQKLARYGLRRIRIHGFYPLVGWKRPVA